MQTTTVGLFGACQDTEKSVTFDDEISNVRHNLPNISIHDHETTAEEPGGNTDHWTDHLTDHEGENDTDHQPGNEGPKWEEIADVASHDAAGPDNEVHNIPTKTVNYQPMQVQGRHRTWQQPMQVQGRHHMG